MLGIGLGITQLSLRAPFSPAALFAASEPGVWLDPTDLSTLFQDDAGTTPVTAAGQTVGLVLDKSGRGNHATQSVFASRPLYQVDSGGRGYLAFDGVDDFLVTPTITPGTDKVQVFAGVRKLSDVGASLFGLGENINLLNGSFEFLVRYANANAEYAFVSRGTSTRAAEVDNSAFSAPVTSLITGLGDISGDRTTLRIDGTQVAQSAEEQGTGNYLAYPLYIGARGGTTLPFNGPLYGLITRFGPNLTADQISQTERWMNARTGAF